MNKKGIATLSISVPVEFRALFEKPKQFWVELGDFFVDLVGKVDAKDYDPLTEKYENVIQFIQEILPE